MAPNLRYLQRHLATGRPFVETRIRIRISFHYRTRVHVFFVDVFRYAASLSFHFGEREYVGFVSISHWHVFLVVVFFLCFLTRVTPEPYMLGELGIWAGLEARQI